MTNGFWGARCSLSQGSRGLLHYWSAAVRSWPSVVHPLLLLSLLDPEPSAFVYPVMLHEVKQSVCLKRGADLGGPREEHLNRAGPAQGWKLNQQKCIRSSAAFENLESSSQRPSEGEGGEAGRSGNWPLLSQSGSPAGCSLNRAFFCQLPVMFAFVSAPGLDQTSPSIPSHAVPRLRLHFLIISYSLPFLYPPPDL